MLERVRGAYDRDAARYDRRWAAYNRRSLEIVRPWLEGREVGVVLDAGCGTGNLLPALARWNGRAARYIGVDASLGMLEVARGKAAGVPWPAALAAGAVEALPVPDAASDTVVCASILHALADPAEALRELRRVLRPDGRLVLLDWSRDPLPMRLLDLGMRIARVPYRRMYARREVEALLAAAGFRVEARARGAAGGPWRLAAFLAAPAPGRVPQATARQ